MKRTEGFRVVEGNLHFWLLEHSGRYWLVEVLNDFFSKERKEGDRNSFLVKVDIFSSSK